MKNDIDTLIFEAVFGDKKQESRKIIRERARILNIIPSSIYPIYQKIATEQLHGFTVPAFNLRTLTYDFARALFRAAKRADAGLLIFELARQERHYTSQNFDEYVTCILAGALRENFCAPVFIQADHVQISRDKFFKSQEEELKDVKDLIKEAISSGVYNIDVDASTLVELNQKSDEEKQRNNFKITSQLVKFIREIQPTNIMVNIGGEIGEIGKKNSSSEDLCAFMDGLEKELGKNCIGISKLSIQTGTTHGGVVLPDGKIAEVKIDFESIRKLSEVARKKYGLAGVVQHGASTLPIELFNKFPENNCIEIHLATGIQNMFFDAEELPTDFKEELYNFIKQNYVEQREAYATQEQFIYKTRKLALGKFKEKIWQLPEDIKNAISEMVEEWAFKILNLLKVQNTKKLIKSLKVKNF